MSDKSRHSESAAESFTLEMPRRDFLVLGSAAMLGVATSGLGSTLSAGIKPQVLPGEQILLSVGFWNGIVDTDYGIRRTWPMVAADSVGKGDRSFLDAGIARVKIHGYWRSPLRHGDDARSLTIIPRYPVGGMPSKINVLALNYVDRSNMINDNRRGSFVVPLAADGMLDLAIDQHTVPSAGLSRHRAMQHPAADPAKGEAFAEGEIGQVLAFRTDDMPSTLKLQRGTYAIAIGTRPDWSSLRIVDQSHLLSSKEGALVTSWTEQPVTFDYVLLSIDNNV